MKKHEKACGVLFAALIIIVGAYGVLYVAPSPKQAEAQIINIETNGVRRIIGERPTQQGPGVYRPRRKWVLTSLAVYVDGKRMQRGVDYKIQPRFRQFIFNVPTTVESVVIVDYEPR